MSWLATMMAHPCITYGSDLANRTTNRFYAPRNGLPLHPQPSALATLSLREKGVKAPPFPWGRAKRGGGAGWGER